MGAVLVSIAIGLVLACSGNPGTGSALERSVATAQVALRVMSFNIEWGGTNVSFDSVVDAVRASGAEIVGVQEADGNLSRLAAELGWNMDLRNYVISKYPILDPPGADGIYVYIEVRPDEIVAVGNVHLPSDPYGPDWVKDGRSAEDVLQLERRVRLPKIEPYVDSLSELAGQGVPVFLTGDFNAPSHADWSAAAVGTRPTLMYAIDWPVSRALNDAGFRDSFRQVHLDPLSRPGWTWWAKRPRIRDYNPGHGDPQDRIDFVWYAGPAWVTGSELVGEDGGPGVSIPVTPWPSDHRGVVSSFAVTPAPLPQIVSARRRLNPVGSPVRIVYNAPGLSTGSIAVSRVPADEGGAPLIVGIGTSAGRVDFAMLDPGEYAVELWDANGIALSRNDFWIVDSKAATTVETLGSRFSSGEPLPIRWSNGPGNRNDWLAVFEAAKPQADFVAWAYVGARVSGALELSEATAESGWPIAPGSYVVRLLRDDGFDRLAESARFEVE